ncbi:hypothetical protein SUGI_1169870 [Cryptomeria japonica]|nr:hypothetical protein SUGI_1169870 [Cryptomeria japonica]
MLLRQKGVDIIILKRLDFDSILEALEDEAVQKLIIAICPFISGIKKTRLNFNIPPSKLNRLTTRMSKDVALVEGCFLKDFCYTGHGRVH